jgi:hypothetical protein
MQLPSDVHLRIAVLIGEGYYESARRLLLREPLRDTDDFDLDAMLRTAENLYIQGDRVNAVVLWKRYLRKTDAPSYVPQADALRKGLYQRFFLLTARDEMSYSQGGPGDIASGGIPWIYAGVHAGQHGNYALARERFRQATLCHLWDPAYAVYGWAAATFALGDRQAAQLAWLAASVEGGSPPGDLPFNNNADAAAVTMLLRLYPQQ